MVYFFVSFKKKYTKYYLYYLVAFNIAISALKLSTFADKSCMAFTNIGINLP